MRRGLRGWTLFTCAAAALIAWLLRDAILHGYVLGQSDVLFDLPPWQAYRPLGWRVRMPLLSDAAVVTYPFLHHAKDAILSGHFPLWSAAMGGGRPFFAAFQTSLLSPFTIADYLLPFPWSFAADAGLRLLCGGVGMYALLRAWRVSTGAAWFGGIAYLLNPFSVVWLEHPLSAVAACLPWLLFGVEYCVGRGDGRGVAALALATAATLLTGHPETAFKVVLLGAGFACLRAIRSPAPLRRLSLAAAGMLLGLACTAIQVLPFLEYAGQSRVLAARAAADGPLFTSPASAFATAFVPDFYGHPLRHRFVLDGTNYCEQQVYSALIVWLCAPLALAHKRLRAHAAYFLAAAAVAVLIMYGTPVARWAGWLLPPLRVAALSRFGLLAIAGLAIAAAIGFDAAFGEQSLAARRRVPVSLAIGATALAIGAIVAAFLQHQHALLAQTSQWPATLNAVMRGGVILAAALVVLLLGADLPRRALMLLACGVLGFDLLLFADGFHPLLPRSYAYPAVPEIAFIRRDAGVYRVAGWQQTLPPNSASVYGLQDFRSYDGVGLRRYDELLETAFHFNGTAFELVNVATPQVIDLLNIRYVVASKEIDLPRDRFRLVYEGGSRVFVNERADGRAFLVDQYVVAKGDEARRLLRGGIDVSRAAVLDEHVPADLRPDRADGDVGSSSITHYEDARVEIRTRAGGRRLLVLSDVYYPGWTATIDGRPARIFLADHAFRAVSVPQGEHVIAFRYRPASVLIGGIVSLAAGAGVALLLLLSRTPRTAATPRDGR